MSHNQFDFYFTLAYNYSFFLIWYTNITHVNPCTSPFFLYTEDPCSCTYQLCPIVITLLAKIISNNWLDLELSHRPKQAENSLNVFVDNIELIGNETIISKMKENLFKMKVLSVVRVRQQLAWSDYSYMCKEQLLSWCLLLGKCDINEELLRKSAGLLSDQPRWVCLLTLMWVLWILEHYRMVHEMC